MAGCVVELEAERADDLPGVFATIRVRYAISGLGLDPKKVELAVPMFGFKNGRRTFTRKPPELHKP